VEANHSEQLTEAVETFLEQRRDRFERRVSRADTGAAGGDDDLRGLIGQPLAMVAATCEASSLTMAWPATEWPARSRSSRIAWPPVSFVSVRVSLTVRTKQRPRAGPAPCVRENSHRDYERAA
jgi:hypothetical protein